MRINTNYRIEPELIKKIKKLAEIKCANENQVLK
jgi:hypothetical protein